MSEILINNLTGNLDKERAKQMWQTETRQKKRGRTYLDKIYHINKETDSLHFKALNQSNQSVNVG